MKAETGRKTAPLICLTKIEKTMKQPDLSTIDFKPLEIMLSQLLHYPIKFEKIEIQKKNSFFDSIIQVRSNELKDVTGILTGLYTKLIISNFGGGITQDNKHYWLPLHFSFEYKSGGSNGAELCSLYYSFTKKEWCIQHLCL